MLVYILVPNKKVRFWHAFWGAIIAVVGFFIMRKFFGAFIASSVAYTTLYGALAAVPLNTKKVKKKKMMKKQNVIITVI